MHTNTNDLFLQLILDFNLKSSQSVLQKRGQVFLDLDPV